MTVVDVFVVVAVVVLDFDLRNDDSIIMGLNPKFDHLYHCCFIFLGFYDT